MTEAQRIAAWLRRLAGDAAETMRCLHKLRTLTPAQTAEWEVVVANYTNLASAIEAGEWETNDGE